MQVKIENIGHKGHAIANVDGKSEYMAFALPDELVEISKKDDGYKIDKILEPSKDRIKPKCKHFTKCGACIAQHMSADFYNGWKKSNLEYALANHNIDKPIDDYVSFDEDEGDINRRRRVKLAAKRSKKSITIGYHKAASHDIIPLEECPIVTKNIMRMLPLLGDFLTPLMSRKAISYVSITDYNGVVDVALENVKYDHSYDEINYINEQANKLDITRIVINGELIIQRKDISENFNGVPVTPVAAGFMQAVKAAEMVISNHVKRLIGDVKGDIVDLFAGIGTFTFALAQTHKVDAFDNDKQAILALQTAYNKAGANPKLKLKLLNAVARDLYRRPLFKDELNKYAAAIIDPPRAGAAEQVKQICDSKINQVVYISCNAQSFAKDAENLLKAGFELKFIAAIDQFKYSSHLELVAHLVRAK